MEPQSLREVMQWQPREEEALVAGILTEQSRGIIYGRYKSLKSMLAMYLALCLGDGRDFLGFATPRAGVPVLYLQIEMPHRFIRKRLEKMLNTWPHAEHSPMLDQVHIWSEPYIKLDTDAGRAQLEQKLNLYKPSLLIVDPIYKVMSGNILDPNAVRGFLDSLDRTIAKYECAVMLVSHTRKGLYDDWGSDDMIGSMFFSAWADAVIRLARKEVKQQVTGQIILTATFDVLRHSEDEVGAMEVMFNKETMEFKSAQDYVQV